MRDFILTTVTVGLIAGPLFMDLKPRAEPEIGADYTSQYWLTYTELLERCQVDKSSYINFLDNQEADIVILVDNFIGSIVMDRYNDEMSGPMEDHESHKFCDFIINNELTIDHGTYIGMNI